MTGARSQLLGTWGARTADELLAALRGPGAAAADLIELRLDLPRDGAARVRELVAASPRPVVATCRRASEGGGFAAGERDRIDVLLRAAGAGAAWLDVEDDVPDRDVERLLASGAKLLRSRHVQRLEDDADWLAARLDSLPGHAAKLVVLHGSAADALAVLTIVRESRGRLCGHVADVPFTRAASAALGAPFVYAAIAPGGTVGVPMPTVLTLRRRDDFERIAAGTRLFVLLGANVEGSVSPQMLNVAFAACGADAVALRWSCDDPVPALEAIGRFGWAGAAVTIPHKETVLAWLRRNGVVAEDAEETGAVNTVVRSAAGLVGHNTDVGGVCGPLFGYVERDRLAGAAMLILGAGGAARAAVVAARKMGLRPVVYARRPEAAAALGCDVAATAVDAAAMRPGVVVNATPTGAPGGTPFFDPTLLRGPAVFLDMLVHARPTALLAAAVRAGHRDCLDGLAMLLPQAALQVERLGLKLLSAPYSASLLTGESWLRRRDAPIVLVGLRCAGKTTVGERVAAMLGRTFLDTDREVERRAGRSVEDLLQAGQERHFRALEADVLLYAVEAPGTVVACGGGAALHAAPFAELAAWGWVVLLDAPDDVLLARRAASPRTPLTSLTPAEELARQRAERMPVYRRAARLTLDVATLDAEAAAASIAAAWDALPPEVWSARPEARP